MKNIEKGIESFYQPSKSGAKERGKPDYFSEARHLLGREFKHLEVFDIFKGLNNERSDELLTSLQNIIRSCKGKNKEEKFNAKKEWLDQATSRADIYRLGGDPDEPPVAR